VESPLPGDRDGGFGERPGETDREQSRHRAPGRLNRTGTWEAIVGVDPDRIEVSVSSSLTGVPIDSKHWDHLDQMVYEVGE
jgi:hypothetical protein